MKPRHLYAAGSAIGIVGSLVLAAGTVLAGDIGMNIVWSPVAVMFVFVICLVTALRQEDVEYDRTLAYRAGNWIGAVLVVGLGLVILVVGVWFFRWVNTLG
ncbi:hypothetical protein [Haloarcula halophila]|uniref:hypothetical protein n=1 Tax=Haloarcula TaxID=2237 RepID=UPI0023E4593A|nr:hypothetical protein [Halomicroarcula sp. DFY41]